jgi:hypothetical protein
MLDSDFMPTMEFFALGKRYDCSRAGQRISIHRGVFVIVPEPVSVLASTGGLVVVRSVRLTTVDCSRAGQRISIHRGVFVSVPVPVSVLASTGGIFVCSRAGQRISIHRGYFCLFPCRSAY